MLAGSFILIPRKYQGYDKSREADCCNHKSGVLRLIPNHLPRCYYIEEIGDYRGLVDFDHLNSSEFGLSIWKSIYWIQAHQNFAKHRRKNN
jgi:hypothetical protein